MKQIRRPGMRRLSVLLTTFSAGVGIVGGIGLYTFFYAQGLSYMSSDPKACVNCHIMQDQFDSWVKSSHHTVATCNDCHLPHQFIGKWLAKAENGWNHSRAFTLQNFPEPIRITEKNAQILQESCLHCHQQLIDSTHLDVSSMSESGQCVHCHRDVGHGPKTGIGKYNIPSSTEETKTP